MSTPTPSSSPRLPIDTCEGLFEKLKWDYKQLEDGWNEYRTFNFVVTAHHLFTDWIDRAGDKQQKRRKQQLPTNAKQVFAVWRDITNATKHWKLNAKSRSKQVVSTVSKPQIADWYAYFVAGPVIYVSVNGTRPSLPELASVTLKCFEWILQAKSTSFPPKLTKDISTVFRPLASTSGKKVNNAPNPVLQRTAASGRR